MVEIDEERLNDSVPEEAVVNVLLKKIKRQAQEIGKLQAALMEHEDTIKKQQNVIKKSAEGIIKISQIMAVMTREEIKELKESSIYREMEQVKRAYEARLKQRDKDVELLITKLNVPSCKLEEKEMSN